MSELYYAKVYKIGEETMVAACDKVLLGRKFRERGIVLDVKEDFYKGENIGEAELKRLLSSATIINLIGKECVRIADEMGLVQSKIVVQNIPHVQIFEMR
jgi:uncharacterized protein